MFRTRFLITCILSMAAAQFCFAQDAADPSGTWTWERSFNNNEMNFIITLTHDDKGQLSGTYSQKRNDNLSDPVDLDDLKLDGSKLTFSVTRTRNDRTFKTSYEGTVSVDRIEGVSKRTRNGEQRESVWIAERVGTSGPTWTSLFDGKTLEGWERVGNENSKWVVEDGAMTATGPASMLVNTSGPYKNFRYRAECKISDGGNSGLYFRTTRNPGFSDGYEAQIDSTHTDPIRTGSLYGMCHVYQRHVDPDTWFTYDLEVRDGVWRGRNMTRVKITVDGNELYEYMDFESTFKEGYFAFQHHDPGSIVHIRKVEVMPLDD